MTYPIPPIGFTGEKIKERKDPLAMFLWPTSNGFFLKESRSEAINVYSASKTAYLREAIVFKLPLTGFTVLDSIHQGLGSPGNYLLSSLDHTHTQETVFGSSIESLETDLSSGKYSVNHTLWSFVYFYVALIGFYITVIIHFNKKIDLAAKVLISGFIFIHSFFILHICVSVTNYNYQFPHSYLMSTCFSFLYGPLLYFYLKRITQKYKFKPRDLLHLLPTILMLIYLIPIYALPKEDKLRLMLHRGDSGYNISDMDFLMTIVTLKLVSLVTYGYFIRRVYLKSMHNANINSANKKWQNTIYRLHILYIFSYAIYGILIINGVFSGLAYHVPIIFMALMVLYVGYSANVRPNVFSGLYSLDNGLLFKYKKSGLTKSLSKELKQNLIQLFDQEKIYKENDISLDTVAERLNTSRHNASQVINEHFNMNFHELINKYRIQEAKSILEMDNQGNLNIIDIAYEVGYNNKVTFNKAFKKETNLTPSEYQKRSIGVRA